MSDPKGKKQVDTPTESASTPGAAPPTVGAPAPPPLESKPGTTAPSKITPSLPSSTPALALRLREKRDYSKMAQEKLALAEAKTLPEVSMNMDEIQELAIAATYDSFDPQVIKINLHKALEGNAQKFMQVLLAVVYFGNNPYERVQKALDPDRLKGMMEMMRSAGVVRRKVNSSSLTLARIGQSHPVAVLALRKSLNAAKLLPTNGVRLDVTVAQQLQDLSLVPLSDKLPNIQAFIVSFAKALYQHAKRTKKDNGMTEAEWLDNQEKFRQISTGSFTRDDQFGHLTPEAINGLGLKTVLALLDYK